MRRPRTNNGLALPYQSTQDARHPSFLANSGLALAVGLDGTVYVAGYAGSQFPTSSNATQGAFDGGYSDGFILVMSQP